MPSVPASAFVKVTPGVLGAGGNQLDTIGLMLTQNTRAPFGQVLEFASDTNVGAYFGLSSLEFADSEIYFAGPTNAEATPGSLLFTQYPATAIGAYLRGGNISGLTLQQLQALSGSISIVVDGYTRSGSVNFSSANSFSSAAQLLQTSLNNTLGVGAGGNGTIGGSVSMFTGSISGQVLTVSSIQSGGQIVIGGLMGTAGGVVAANTIISGQLTGTPNGVGTYSVTVPQVVASGSGLTETYGVLTLTSSFGTIAVGQTVGTIGGGSIPSGTIITQAAASGGTGVYYTNNQMSSGTGVAITVLATAVTVSFDSVSGAFIINSGIVGAASTIQFATGTGATNLLLTSSTGAVESQGSPPLTPQAFMTLVTEATTNWAGFMLNWDPDLGGSGGGFATKLAFAEWNGLQDDEFVFFSVDKDPTPSTETPAPNTYGNAIETDEVGGTCLIWEPNTGGPYKSAVFAMGVMASINFGQVNGRLTFAYKGQSGLTPAVTNQTVMNNLIANGYNMYVAAATANNDFDFFWNGSISGTFLWLDSYVNQIWMNSEFQLALMEYQTSVKSTPYTPAGYASIEAALGDPITAAGTFGAFRSGVELSNEEISQVNGIAGFNIATTIEQVGYYLLITDPGVQVRSERGSPNINFWYADGESIQVLAMNSTALL